MKFSSSISENGNLNRPAASPAGPVARIRYELRATPRSIRDVPGPTPEHRVAEEPDGHPPDVGEALARDVGRDLAPLDRLVKCRQRLRAKEHRREELEAAWDDLDPRSRQVKDGAGVDDNLVMGYLSSGA